jgi:hypothetical protein
MAKMLSLFLVYLLCVGTLRDARAGGGQSPRVNNEEKQKALNEQVAGIAAGSIVEIRLHNKEFYRGRLGQLTDQGLTVQHVAGNNIQDKTVSFADMKSIKEVNANSRTVKTVTWIVVGVLGTAAVIVIVLLSKILNN